MGSVRMVRALRKKQKHDKGRFDLTDAEAERLIEDGDADDLQGLGWEPSCDSDSEDVSNEPGQSAPPAVNQPDFTGVVVTGAKRKAEDQTDDSERRPAPRKDQIQDDVNLYCCL